jgi:hypothetical protein
VLRAQGHYWQRASDAPIPIEEAKVLWKIYRDLASAKHKQEKFNNAIISKTEHVKKTIHPVICLETGVIYESASAAAIAVDGRATNICNACNGKTGHRQLHTYKGFHWAYYDSTKTYNSNECIPAGRYAPVGCIETGNVYRNAMAAAREVLGATASKEEVMRGRVCISHSISAKIGWRGLHWYKHKDGEYIPSLDEYKDSNKRRCQCIDTGEIFETAKDAGDSIGAAATNIVRCCRGKARSVKGFHWRYYTEEV